MTAHPAFDTFFSRHKTGINIVVCGLLQLISLTIFGNDGLWWTLLGLVATSALYFRYRFPRGIVVVVVTSLAVSLFSPTPLFNIWWVAPFTVYHVARYGNRLWRTTLLVLGLIGSVISGFVVVSSSSTHGSVYSASQDYWTSPILWFARGFAVLFSAALITAAWFYGDSRRLRQARQQELIDRATRLEHEREQERRLAAQDERTRIAREIHDIVAHSLSVVITQADGARYALTATSEAQKVQDIASSTLETVSKTARGSLAQMRQLLGILHTDENTAYAPLPTLEQLPQLIETVTASGFTIDAVLPPYRVEALPPGAELTAYRIVQEALTNITKHAPATPQIWVQLTDSSRELSILVENAASPTTENIIPGSGRGLIGMRQRVNLYNGSLNFGVLASGGFRVQASLPKKDH